MDRSSPALLLEARAEPLLHGASNTLQEIHAIVALWTLDLEEQALDPALMQPGRTVLPALVRLQQDVIDDLRDLLALHDGTLAVDLRPAALAPIVRAAVSLLEASTRSGDTVMRVLAPSALPLVHTDAVRLRRLLAALVFTMLRAWRAAPAAAGLTLALAVVDNAVVLTLPIPPYTARTLDAWCDPFQEALLDQLQIRPVVDDGALAFAIPCAAGAAE